MPRPARFRLSATPLILLSCLAYYVSTVVHGRAGLADFRTYWFAAGNFVAGRPLYFVVSPEAPLLYRYAPPVALLFWPFSLLPVVPATVVWYAINSLLVVALLRLLVRRLGPLPPGHLVAFFLAVGFTLERELNIGNVNLLAIVTLLAALMLVERARSLAGSALVALMILAKLPNALLLVPLGARRPRLLAWIALCGLVLLALPLPAYGWDGTLRLYLEFGRSLRDFAARFGDTFKYHATTAGLLERVLGAFGLHLRPHPLAQLAGGLAALAVLVVAERRRLAEPLPYLLGLALVPVSATADYNVFVFVAPLVYWLLARRLEVRGSRARDALLLAGLILYGGNWHDLLGHRLSVFLSDMGVHGLGTWVLILLALTAPPATSSAPAPTRSPA